VAGDAPRSLTRCLRVRIYHRAATPSTNRTMAVLLLSLRAGRKDVTPSCGFPPCHSARTCGLFSSALRHRAKSGRDSTCAFSPTPTPLLLPFLCACCATRAISSALGYSVCAIAMTYRQQCYDSGFAKATLWEGRFRFGRFRLPSPHGCRFGITVEWQLLRTYRRFTAPRRSRVSATLVTCGRTLEGGMARWLLPWRRHVRCAGAGRW